jgi:DNA polymerase I-like protein with 3'-5' exonuclease and polymerase domains
VLVILSKDSEKTVLKAIGPVLQAYPDVPVRVFLSAEVITEKPTAILALGAKVLEEIQAMGLAPKNRKLTSLRCKLHQMGGIPLMFSYNVGISDVDHGNFVDLLTDVSQALRLAKTGSLKPVPGKYEYVKNLAGLVWEIKGRLNTEESVDLAFDTETRGLDRFDPEGFLVSLQFSHRKGESKVWAFPTKQASLEALCSIDGQADLAWLFSEPRIKVCAANGKYDLEWLYEHAMIECTNFTFDTTAVGSLLDENRSNGLDVHAKIYTQMGGYSDEFDQKADKSRMDLEYVNNPDAFLNYAGGDTDATLQVKQAQKEILLQDERLTGFYVNILHPALRAFEKVERGGVYVDAEEFKALDADLNNELLGLTEKAKDIIGGMLTAKHWDPDKPGGLNLTKASLISDFMFSPAGLNMKPKMLTEKTKAPVTSLEHLNMFSHVAEAEEFVSLMRDFSSATKTLGTFVRGFMKHLRSDGKFHPAYWLFAGNRDNDDGGTNTGRLSVKDPAFQTIPHYSKWGTRLRRCYPAPPGYRVLEVDYSQGELRVVACVAGEPTMIKAYLSGMDLHALTGGQIGGYTYEQMMEFKESQDKAKQKLFKALRQQAKAGNFGLLYGMGVDGFMEYARLQYGVVLTKAEAEQVWNTFFETYPALLTYHHNYKAFARKYGYVVSPLGRVRHLPLVRSPRQEISSKAERQAINSPIQGCLSDMMVWAIAIHNQKGWQLDAPCFGAIHDAGYYYIPEDNVPLWAGRVRDTMENLPFEQVGWKPQLKFIADAKVGPNMADLTEVA